MGKEAGGTEKELISFLVQERGMMGSKPKCKLDRGLRVPRTGRGSKMSIQLPTL